MKNYLPENMGFPVRSVSDMLPDNLLICPATYSNGHKKQVGLLAKVCAGCGRTFEAAPEHRFKILKKRKGVQKMEYYCSYSCFRPAEKKEAEIFKYKALGCVKEYDPSKDNVERAQARVAECKEKLADIRHQIFDDPVAFRLLGASQRKNLKNKLSVWTEKLAYAQERLKEVEAYEAEEED